MQIVPVSYNGHNINDGTAFSARFAPEYPELAAQNVTSTPRSENWPVHGGKVIQGKTIPILIKCLGNSYTQIDTLKGWFDTADQNEHALVITDAANSSKSWYVNATPVSMPEVDGGVVHVVLNASDPVYKSSTLFSGTVTFGTVTATGTVTAGGNSNAYPVFEITPSSAKTGTYGYKRDITIVNTYSKAIINYPFNVVGTAIFNSGTLVSDGKMQADGDDLRIRNGNTEVPRWLNGINTGTTNVWCNLSIASGGTASLTMLYGSTAVADPGYSDTEKPIIELNSSNASWIYENFADDDNKRTGSWTKVQWSTKGGKSDNYTKTHADDEDPPTPASVMGMQIEAWQKRNKWMAEDASIWWTFYNPLGVTSVDFTSEKYRYSTGWPSIAKLQKSTEKKAGKYAWKDVITCATPGTAQVWGTAVSGSVSLSGTFPWMRWILDGGLAATDSNVVNLQVNSGTVNLANVPTVTFGAEADNYYLSATIANTTTGESFTITGAIGLDKTITIDTDAKTVTYEGQNYLAGLALSTTRNEWLKLAPGANVITYTETGSTAGTVVVSWRDRNN